MSEYSLPFFNVLKKKKILGNVIIRENIKRMFSLFYHFANIMETYFFECSLNVLNQVVRL